MSDGGSANFITHFNAGVWSENLQNNNRLRSDPQPTLAGNPICPCLDRDPNLRGCGSLTARCLVPNIREVMRGHSKDNRPAKASIRKRAALRERSCAVAVLPLPGQLGRRLAQELNEAREQQWQSQQGSGIYPLASGGRRSNGGAPGEAVGGRAGQYPRRQSAAGTCPPCRLA